MTLESSRGSKGLLM